MSSRRLERDPGAMPRYKERVPYVVAMAQNDQSRLKDLVIGPDEFMARDGLMLNHNYYIKKQINPALNRIFLELFDIDVNHWYDKMPKRIRDQGTKSRKIGYFSQRLNNLKSTTGSVISASHPPSRNRSPSSTSSMSIAV